MLLVDSMVFAPCLMPAGVVGKEDVGLGWCVGYLGETETVGKGQGLLIDGGSANDVDVFIGLGMAEGFLKGGIDNAPWQGLDCA
jgi:hypothetical protein